MRARSWFPAAIPGRTVVLRPHNGRNLPAFKRWYGDPEVARLTRYQEAVSYTHLTLPTIYSV